MVKPIERVLRSGLFGPWGAPRHRARRAAARSQPGERTAWGLDSFVFFPNFMLLIWKPNWVLTYHYWPTSYNTHIFEGTLLLRPPKNARRTAGAGAGRRHVQGVRLQDGNTLEATQSMLEVPHAGQEVPAQRPGGPAAAPAPHRAQLRATTEQAPAAKRHPRRCEPRNSRDEHDPPRPVLAQFADLQSYAEWALPTERERYQKRIASTMDELQAFYDAAFPRMEEALTYLEQYSMDDLPDDATNLLWLYCALVTVSFPVEVWRQPRRARRHGSTFDAVLEPAV